LGAVVEFYAAVASSVQDLLDRDRPLPVDHLGDFGQRGDILVVTQRKLTEIGFSFPLAVGIGPLVRDDPATGPGDDLHSSHLPFRRIPVQGIEVGNSAGGVLDAVCDIQPAELSGFKKAYKVYCHTVLSLPFHIFT
jgi:hypothetical protein